MAIRELSSVRFRVKGIRLVSLAPFLLVNTMENNYRISSNRSYMAYSSSGTALGSELFEEVRVKQGRALFIPPIVGCATSSSTCTEAFSSAGAPHDAEVFSSAGAPHDAEVVFVVVNEKRK